MFQCYISERLKEQCRILTFCPLLSKRPLSSFDVSPNCEGRYLYHQQQSVSPVADDLAGVLQYSTGDRWPDDSLVADELYGDPRSDDSLVAALASVVQVLATHR